MQEYKIYIENKLRKTWDTQEYILLSKLLFCVTQIIHNQTMLTCNSELEK